MKRILALGISVLYAILASAQSTSGNASAADTAANKSSYSKHWNSGTGRDGHHYRGDRNQAMNRYGRDRHRGFRVHYTEQQKQQMKTIEDDYRQKSAALWKNDNLTLKQYKSQLLALQKDRKNKLQGLLTDDQKAQIAKEKKKMQEEMQVQEAARLERMKIDLKLTNDQASSIQSKQQSFRQELQSLRENDNLLPMEKREEIKTLAMNQKEAIRAVLTPDQISAWESMHERGSKGK